MNISGANYLLDKFYPKTVLVELYQEYFHTWIEKGWVSTSLSPKLDRQGLIKVTKLQFIDILRQFYMQSDLCKKAYALFSPAVQKALFQAAWYQNAEITAIEKEFQIQIAQRDRQYHGKSSEFGVLEKPFRLFQYKGNYYGYGWQYGTQQEKAMTGSLYLPVELRELLQNNLPKPLNYELHPVKTIEAAHIHTSSDEIASLAELYYTYIAEGNVKRTPKTGAIPASSVKTMQQYCEINEFFSAKPFDYIKTAAMLILFSFCDPIRQPQKTYTYKTSPEVLKQALTDFFTNTARYTLPRSLLSYIKGQFMYVEENNIGGILKTVLMKFPKDGTWITIENLLDYLIFRKITFNFFVPWQAERYLYIADITKNGYQQTKHLDRDNDYQTYVTTPLIKALMFFLAAVGVVDIAYDTLDFPEKTPPLHPFDTLKAIRLTAFGQYVLGIKSTFTAPKSTENNTIIADEHTLSVTLTGTNKLLELTLGRIGIRMTDTRYQVSFESLFKGCHTITEVKRKIATFKNKAPSPLPKNWETFFYEALSQKNPLTEEEYVVLKIKNDRKLINFIATDPYLKANVIKAEGYRILVSKYELATVKSHLSKAGYFSEE